MSLLCRILMRLGTVAAVLGSAVALFLIVNGAAAPSPWYIVVIVALLPACALYVLAWRLAVAARSWRGKLMNAGSSALMLAGVWMVLLSAGTFIVLWVQWLRLGEWPNWTPAALGYSAPQTALLELNKVLVWLFDRSIAFLAFGIGFGLLALGAVAKSSVQPRQLA